MKTASKVFWILCLLPVVYAGYQVWLLQTGRENQLGADPGEALVHLQGEWALYFLILTLLITPLRRLTGISNLIWLRRTLGLAMFTYATLHLLSYLAFLLEWRFEDLFDEIVERPYITVGALALLGLFPLALTSNTFARRRLGKRWITLHKLVYPIAILVVIHLAWLAKSDYGEVVLYGGILLALLGLRVLWYIRRQGASGRLNTGV